MMDSSPFITPVMTIPPSASIPSYRYVPTFAPPVVTRPTMAAVMYQPKPITKPYPELSGQERTIASADGKHYHSVTLSSMTHDCIGVGQYSSHPDAIRAATFLSAIDFVTGIIGEDDLDPEEIAPDVEGQYQRALVRVHNGSCASEDDWQVFSSYAITAAPLHMQRRLFHKNVLHRCITLGNPMITPHAPYHIEDVVNAIFALRGERS